MRPLVPTLLGWLSLCAACSLAQADPVDDIVLAEMKRTNTPGISLAVVRDGKIIREQGYGLANVEHQVPVTPATVFQSGSVGKQFTAALVLLLAADGKLRLDDPISHHLPKSPKAWEHITVRQLLTHTSGMGDATEKLDLRRDYTDAEMVAIAAKLPLLSAPGQRWAYSNTGYALLGYICNKAGGKFYGDQLRERIFIPLGMGTRVINERDIVPHRAAGYEPVNGQLRNQEWVSPTLNSTADGSLYLTAHDLALWDLALYGDKVLTESMKQASWTPVRPKDGSTPDYGFGWQLRPVNGHRRISHDGLWQGFRSQFSRFIDHRLSVIVLSNSSAAPPEKIANLVAAHYLPDLVAKALADTEPQITARAREIVAQFGRATQPPRLSIRTKAKYTPKVLANIALDMRDFGKLLALDPIARTVKGRLHSYVYRMRFENETNFLELDINRAGAIERIEFLAD